MNTPHTPNHQDHSQLASVKWMDAAQTRITKLEAQRNELREALEIIERGACLQQINQGRCICYSCIARAVLNHAKD